MIVFYGVLYLLGLVLLVMPARVIPWFDGKDPAVRMSKHGLGLILFAWGTIGIHRIIRAEVGNAFLFWSLIAVLAIMLGRVWWSNRSEPE